MSQELARVGDIGAGVGTMADGLSQLIVEVNPNDPKVKAIRGKIAGSAEFKDQLGGCPSIAFGDVFPIIPLVRRSTRSWRATRAA